jgi:putative transposase
MDDRQGKPTVPPAPLERQLPDRCHPVHGVHMTTGRPTIVLLTVCTRGRARWLANEQNHALLRRVWTAATAWLVGQYVVMPDHLHLFAAPGSPELDLDAWVKYWKSQFTRANGERGERWQTDHWDARLRNNEWYATKWEYVVQNPVRHGLVTRAEDWPFQGRIFDLEW